MAKNKNVGDVYTVILIGGLGKRLRPLSTDVRPKAFLSVTRDRKTMFKATLDRAKKLVKKDRIIVVGNKKHERLIKIDYPGIPKENLILEPVSRNTAPAITLAAVVLKKRSRDPVMVVLPSDQYITDEEKYLDSIRRGIFFLAVDSGGIVVVGIRPTSPSTGFGYIKLKSDKPYMDAKGVYLAERFVEKPDIAAAKKYLSSGRYLWNSGLFIFKADRLLEEVKRCAPTIYRGLAGKGDVENVYMSMPDVSIDYAVMERAKRVFCVNGNFRWRDMGSFESLKRILKRESRRFIMKDGKVVKVL